MVFKYIFGTSPAGERKKLVDIKKKQLASLVARDKTLKMVEIFHPHFISVFTVWFQVSSSTFSSSN